ncbi:MAG: tRNA lysidine(34) synthetase TilS, partial [Clostridia bacterium]|nr:tRNA lysidine(34) synthetase TilS [Clostridia bacterium]
MELADLQAYAGKRVCVAVSGGVDSVCLLHCFLRAAESLHITLSALTCEHGIRGARSVADCEFVKELCNDWNVPLVVFSADIPARAKASGRGIEEEGRNFRYDCFAEVLENGSADAVATAHHRDDFAETVLFRLARGTSLSGLSAIRERNGIVRPFLSVSKVQIDEYAKFYGLPFVTDESNLDETYARNAIRLSVMPALDRAVNGAAAHLTEFALRAAEDDRYLQALAQREVVREGNVYLIPVDLPGPLFSRACLYAVKQLGCEKDYTSANVKEISCLKELQSGKKACLPRWLCAVREGERVAVFVPEPTAVAEFPFCEGEFAMNGYSCAVSDCVA